MSKWLMILFLSCGGASAEGEAENQQKTDPQETETSVESSSETESLDIRFPVKKIVLENGLTLLLHRDNSVPLISYHTWFRVGSVNEEIGKTGLAHFLEHLMFKGTEKYPGKTFEKLLQSNGITNNAFTTRDFTGYYERLPSSQLELIMKVESDRLENVQVKEPDFKSELEVVKEERRMRVDNSPSGMMWEAMFKSIFRVHPYGWPVIGWMKDIESMQIDWVRDFYKKYYAVNNAVLVIAGDIDLEKTEALVRQYYSALKPIDLPASEPIVEPKQQGQRNTTLVKNVQSDQLMVAFHVPKSGTDEAYALDLAANISAKGESSRLHQRLVFDEQIASSVVAYNYTMKEAGVFVIIVSVLPDKSLDDVKKAVFSELWHLRNTAVKPKELSKAKNQVMTEYVNGLTTVDARANALAANEILFSDYSVLFRDLQKYRDVTIEQIQSASERFLNPHQRSVIVLKRRGQ